MCKSFFLGPEQEWQSMVIAGIRESYGITNDLFSFSVLRVLLFMIKPLFSLVMLIIGYSLTLYNIDAIVDTIAK